MDLSLDVLDHGNVIRPSSCAGHTVTPDATPDITHNIKPGDTSDISPDLESDTAAIIHPYKSSSNDVIEIDLDINGPSFQVSVESSIAVVLNENKYPSYLDNADVSLDDHRSREEVEGITIHCMICNRDIGSFSPSERDRHVNQCLDNPSSLPDEEENQAPHSSTWSAATSATAMTEELIGYDVLKSDVLCCIICDIDISKRSLQSRCLHIKGCARIHNISVKDILKMLNPNDDIVDQSGMNDDVSDVRINSISRHSNDINTVLMHNMKYSLN